MEALLRKIEARIADDALSDDESAGERAAAVPSSMSSAPEVDFSQSLRLN